VSDGGGGAQGVSLGCGGGTQSVSVGVGGTQRVAVGDGSDVLVGGSQAGVEVGVTVPFGGNSDVEVGVPVGVGVPATGGFVVGVWVKMRVGVREGPAVADGYKVAGAGK